MNKSKKRWYENNKIKELSNKTHLIRSFKVWNEKRITQSTQCRVI